MKISSNTIGKSIATGALSLSLLLIAGNGAIASTATNPAQQGEPPNFFVSLILTIAILVALVWVSNKFNLTSTAKVTIDKLTPKPRWLLFWKKKRPQKDKDVTTATNENSETDMGNDTIEDAQDK